MSCRICKRGGCIESFHSIEEQRMFERTRALREESPSYLAEVVIGHEDEMKALRSEIEATRRTAGYLAVMVRELDPKAGDYATEILDTPEIAAALKAAADGDGADG